MTRAEAFGTELGKALAEGIEKDFAAAFGAEKSRAEALAAEVEQLRQQLAEAKSMNKEWFHAAAQQHIAHQQTGRYRTDAGWNTQAIAALVQKSEALEASRDHLRARLRQVAEFAQHRTTCGSRFCQTCGEEWGRMNHAARRQIHKPAPCTCGLSDLLAILEAPSEQQQEPKEPDDLSRGRTPANSTDRI